MEKIVHQQGKKEDDDDFEEDSEELSEVDHGEACDEPFVDLDDEDNEDDEDDDMEEEEEREDDDGEILNEDESNGFSDECQDLEGEEYDDVEEEDEEEEEGKARRVMGSGDESDESDYGDDYEDDEDDVEADDNEDERKNSSRGEIIKPVLVCVYSSQIFRIILMSRTGVGPSHVSAKFLEGEKGASFAKAFSKILQHKTKANASDEAAVAPAGGGGPANVLEGPILAVRASKVLNTLEKDHTDSP